MTLGDLEETLAKAIHDDACGADEECGAFDFHTDAAIAVISELTGLGVLQINVPTSRTSPVYHLGDQP